MTIIIILMNSRILFFYKEPLAVLQFVYFDLLIEIKGFLVMTAYVNYQDIFESKLLSVDFMKYLQVLELKNFEMLQITLLHSDDFNTHEKV